MRLRGELLSRTRLSGLQTSTRKQWRGAAINSANPNLKRKITMVYFIGGNGKILTNEMSEAEPSAFSPATDAYRRSKVAEAQAQVEEWKRSHPTSAPTATRT